MADFTTTISNSLNVFGPAPSNKWNAHNWNAFLWGEGTADLVVEVVKVLSESLTLSDALTKSQARVIENSLAPTSDMTAEQVTDAFGYYRLFPGGVTSGEDRVSSTWAHGSATSPTWTSGTVTSTSWSAA